MSVLVLGPLYPFGIGSRRNTSRTARHSNVVAVADVFDERVLNTLIEPERCHPTKYL
mgnify:CR=1 FL=1